MHKFPEPHIVVVAKHARLLRREPYLSDICKQYGRDPEKCAIKIFYGNPLEKGESVFDAKWGDDSKDGVRRNTKLFDGTRIQNICWWHKLSPRVYAMFEAEYQGQRVACQLTEFIEGDEAKDQHYVAAVHKQAVKLGEGYKFFEEKDLLNTKDVIGGKLVDLQQFAFKPDYVDVVKRIYTERGKYGKVYYQDVPELGFSGGPRKSQDRIDYMQLDKIDFTDKVVWDIGCAGGFFCRYALDRGAKIVYGMDEENTCYAAFMVSNHLGKFNIDYRACDLSKGIPEDIPDADIAFFLSMNFHIPIPERLLRVPTVIFEDNGKESRKETTLHRPWTHHFKHITLVGKGKDHGDKPVYHLVK